MKRLANMRVVTFCLTLLITASAFGKAPNVIAVSETEIQVRNEIQESGAPTVFVAAGENANFQVTANNRIISAGKDYSLTSPMHIGPVAVRGVRLDESSLKNQADNISITWDNVAAPERTIPRALVPLLQATVANWSAVEADYNIADHPGHYLIVTDDAFLTSQFEPYVNTYVDWKTRQGFKVKVAPLSETGNTAPDIKSYIQDYYTATDGQLEYVLFIGDADDSHPDNVNKVPAFFYASPTTGDQNVSDHPYSTMDGDYLSDITVGRLPVDSGIELVTMLNKIINYEKTPPEDGWLNRALVVAGNYSNTPPNPITPKWISKWIRTKFLDYGYTEVDTVYYPPTQLGQQTIADYINDGVGLISYRGWADANGWQYPQFKISDISSLINNAPHTPIIASIVCNTGDFANNVDPVFGEKWMRLGTPTNPKGAAGFFGPSDLHTSTKFNNSIASGFYEGILTEGIHDLGAAAYRGKMQLFHGFPREQGDEGWVEFYFHVYNILGDPSTEIRTKVPLHPNVTIPDELPTGTTRLEFKLQNSAIDEPDQVYASVMSPDDTTGAYFDRSGNATVVMPPLTGNLDVSISGPNIYPQLDTISVTQSANFAAITGLQVSNTPKPVATVTLQPTVVNTGAEVLDNCTVELVPVSGISLVGSGEISLPDISSGESHVPETGIDIAIDADYASARPLKLLWRFTTAEKSWESTTELEVQNTLWEVSEIVNADSEPYLASGTENSLHFTLRNFSNYASQSGIVTVTSQHDNVQISGSPVSFDAVGVESESPSLGGLSVTVPSSFPNGSTFSLTFLIEEDDYRIFETKKLMTVGPITDEDPSGPDVYGYFAYDDDDDGFTPAPTEEDWRESGSGATLYELSDDENVNVSLPWDFQYYGSTYNSLTVSSNGWISFESEPIPWFRNWGIPSPIGPKAMIAGYWDDLDAPGDGAKMEMLTEASGDEFIITWDHSYANYDEETEERFQIILQNVGDSFTPTGDDEILIIYDEVEDVDQSNNYSTVGIESPDKRGGLQYVYSKHYIAGAGELRDDRAIRFTTRQPDGFVTKNEPDSPLPEKFQVSRNYPNPFNPSTQFTVSIPGTGAMTVRVVNVMGQVVWEQSRRSVQPGKYRINWDGFAQGKPAGSGIYWYQVQYVNAQGQSLNQTQKMVLIR